MNATLKNTGTVSLSNATVILELVEGLEPRILDVLRLIAREREEFENLPLDPAKGVKFDLTKLHITCLVSL